MSSFKSSVINYTKSEKHDNYFNDQYTIYIILSKYQIILTEYDTKVRTVYNTENHIKQFIFIYKNIALNFLLNMEKTDEKKYLWYTVQSITLKSIRKIIRT